MPAKGCYVRSKKKNRSKDQIYLAGYLWQIVVAIHHHLIMAKALLLNTAVGCLPDIIINKKSQLFSQRGNGGNLL